MIFASWTQIHLQTPIAIIIACISKAYHFVPTEPCIFQNYSSKDQIIKWTAFVNSSTLNSTSLLYSKSKSHSWNKCFTSSCKLQIIRCINKYRSWQKRPSKTIYSRACRLRMSSSIFLTIRIPESSSLRTQLLDALTKTELTTL